MADNENPQTYTPNVYGAWPSLQKQVNTKLPSALRRIRISERAMIRRLIHQRRVKH